MESKQTEGPVGATCLQRHCFEFIGFRGASLRFNAFDLETR
jgi:hypothetical protein